MDEFAELEAYLRRVPGIDGSIRRRQRARVAWPTAIGGSSSQSTSTMRLAWNVVQELGNVLNYLSVTEHLPTVFKPVSPPSYLNGGPQEYLSWVIESTLPDFSPKTCAQWLEGRLPRPVDDLEVEAAD